MQTLWPSLRLRLFHVSLPAVWAGVGCILGASHFAAYTSCAATRANAAWVFFNLAMIGGCVAVVLRYEQADALPTRQAPYTLRPTPYTPHPPPCTLHPTFVNLNIPMKTYTLHRVP